MGILFWYKRQNQNPRAAPAAGPGGRGENLEGGRGTGEVGGGGGGEGAGEKNSHVKTS